MDKQALLTRLEQMKAEMAQIKATAEQQLSFLQGRIEELQFLLSPQVESPTSESLQEVIKTGKVKKSSIAPTNT